MPKAKHTPLPWKVRRHPTLGCFIEARIRGKPYGQEIMGDDYFPELSREADAEFIVKCVSEFEEAAIRERRLKKALQLHLDFLKSLPPGWLGQTTGDIGLLNEAYIASRHIPGMKV